MSISSQFIHRSALFVAVSLSLGLLEACGGSSSSSTTTTTTQIATITVTPASSAITVGQNQAYTAAVKNSDGTVLTGGVLTWSSSATSVATVDSAGIATGVGAGSTQITASSEGVNSAAVTLTVSPRVASVTISTANGANTVSVGSTIQFSAVAKDSSGNAIPNAVFQWASSASSIATIDQNGLVTGVRPGGVMITGSSGGVLSAPFTLTVQ